MFEKILVKDWMSSPVEAVPPTTPLSEAHQIMQEKNIRRLPVMIDNELVGIISLGDVREASPSDATTLSIWELNYLWAQLTVEKIMTRTVLTIHVDASLLQAAQMMLEHKISGLPVLDSGGKVVGVITESDIFRMIVKLQNAAAMP